MASTIPVVAHRHLLADRGYSNLPFDAIPLIYLPSRALAEPLQRGYTRDVIDAVRHDNCPALEKMLKEGLDPNTQDACGVTLLHKACHMSRAPLVRLLLQYGASVRCSDESGKTPLHDLCWMGSVYIEGTEDIACLLLRQDESMLRARDRLGFVPLDYLRPVQYDLWLRLLIDHCDEWWPASKAPGISPEEWITILWPHADRVRIDSSESELSLS